jgi:hypothetical protein
LTHRYRFISEHHAAYGVARLCRVLAVPRRQGYYEWLAAQPTRQQRAEADDELAVQIALFMARTVARTARRGSPQSCADAAGGSTVSGSSGSCVSVASSATPGDDGGR